MNCCKNPKVSIIRESDGHRLCYSCKSHEYKGITFNKKKWDAMMEDRRVYLDALGLHHDE